MTDEIIDLMAWAAYKEADADKTASAAIYPSKQLKWQNPRSEIKFSKATPFESRLQKEAAMRLRDSVPHSGYVEPQFMPTWGVMKKAGQTGGLLKDDLKNFLKERPKR